MPRYSHYFHYIFVIIRVPSLSVPFLQACMSILLVPRHRALSRRLSSRCPKANVWKYPKLGENSQVFLKEIVIMGLPNCTIRPFFRIGQSNTRHTSVFCLLHKLCLLPILQTIFGYECQLETIVFPLFQKKETSEIPF